MGAKANRAYLALVKETDFGETPATPTLQKLNFTSEDITYNIESTVSSNIRDDRMVSDLILIGAGCEGSFTSEMQYGLSGTTDTLLLAALWAAAWFGVSTTTGATMSGENIGVVGATKTFTFPVADRGQLKVGQKFKVTGSTSNNGIFTVVTANNTTGVYTVAETAVNETFGAAVTVTGEMIRNGLTRHSYTIEKGLTDVEEYFVYRGMVVNEMTMNLAVGELIETSYSFIGKESEVVQVAIGTAYTAPATTSIMSAAFNVQGVKVDGVAISSCLLQSLEISVNNNVSGKGAVGQFGYCDVVDGEFGLSMSASLYFADATFYEKFVDNVAISMDMELFDAAGNSYIITIPKAKFASDVVAVEGKNTDIMDAAELTAIVDPTTSCMFQICRFAA